MSAGVSAAHVLVIDDDRPTLGLYRDLLLDAGYTATQLGYPPDDPEEVARLDPDLVVLDLVFNGEERGWPFIQALRHHPSTGAIPVLVCTAAVQTVDDLAAELAGLSCGVVLKPFDIDRLLAVLDLCLDRPDRDQAIG